MKKMHLALLLPLYFVVAGFDDNQSGRIVPSVHTLAPALSKPASSGGPRYRAYDRETIRRRMSDDPRYTEALDRMKKSIAPFVSLSDEHIRSLIPPAGTKRALMVHRKGCPVHGGGTGVYLPFGTRIDLAHPLQVQCPIGKEWYPNADFPDDGSGWLDNRPNSPTKGDRYYFVGWYNQWFLNSISGYLKPLAQLWFLTGDDVCRHKAMVLLDRFMEVYPDIDSKDLTYDGTDWGVYVKMTGSFWEGAVLLEMANAVEILAPSLDRAYLDRVEARVYRPAFDAYSHKPAGSNWGNNWNMALAKFAAVTGDRTYLDFMLERHPAAEAPVLDNQFFRDGFPYEASLHYAEIYLDVADRIAEVMGSDGAWVWAHPHMRAAVPAFADLVCLDRFTHFAADMGGIANNGWTLPVQLAANAWKANPTPVLARYLLRASTVAGKPGPSIDGLFSEPIDWTEVERSAALAPEEKSTLAPVRGFAVMRAGTGTERSALFLDYGYGHSAHGHGDRLNINFFADGRELIPEMGYPEYMDGIAPATGGWTTHTVCHATVEVDEKRQLSGVFGDLHYFADLEGIKAVEASCEDAYAWRGVDRYRRTLLLLDIPGGAYAVDLFRVRGGNRHDWLFHGPIGELALDGPVLSEPAAGTLAGPDVAFGAVPKGMRSYDANNSGYQYLFDIRTGRADSPVSAVWTMPDGLRFRAMFVPDGAETIIRASGYPKPATKSLPPMPFLVRRHDPKNGVESRFATVMCTERGVPSIKSVRRIELKNDGGVSGYGIEIVHASGRDVILSTVSPDGTISSRDGRFALSGMLGVASWRNGKPLRLTLVGGTSFRAGDAAIRQDAASWKSTVRTTGDDLLSLADPIPKSAGGSILLADRGPVRTAYRIERANNRTTDVSPTTWVGRGRVGTVNDTTAVVRDGRNVFPLGDDSSPATRNYYTGAWIAPTDGRAAFRLKKGGNDGFAIERDSGYGEFGKAFPAGGEFLLYDIGPGDKVWVVNTKQAFAEK